MGTTKLYHVRWRAGQSVVREHSFTSAPLAIAFFSLDAATCLGVLETDRLTIYTQDGSSYSAALPCKPHALWPLRRGLVIEPEWLVSGVDAPLLLIERPLDEPQPVDATAAGHFIHESTILRSDAPRSRLLAHDLTRRRHVLWAIDVTTTTPAFVWFGSRMQAWRQRSRLATSSHRQTVSRRRSCFWCNLPTASYTVTHCRQPALDRLYSEGSPSHRFPQSARNRSQHRLHRWSPRRSSFSRLPAS